MHTPEFVRYLETDRNDPVSSQGWSSVTLPTGFGTGVDGCRETVDRADGLCYNRCTLVKEEIIPMAHSTPRGLQVWFRDEIQNALTAVDTANLDLVSSINTPEIQTYRKGYAAAIRAVAAAFGIPYSPQMLPNPEPEVVDSPGWVHILS